MMTFDLYLLPGRDPQWIHDRMDPDLGPGQYHPVGKGHSWILVHLAPYSWKITLVWSWGWISGEAKEGVFVSGVNSMCKPVHVCSNIHSKKSQTNQLGFTYSKALRSINLSESSRCLLLEIWGVFCYFSELPFTYMNFVLIWLGYHLNLNRHKLLKTKWNFK